MKHHRYPTKRNFGAGRSMHFAVRNALNEAFVGGHFSTRATHAQRAKIAIRYLKSQGVRDFSHVDQQILNGFAHSMMENVEDGIYSLKYATNVLSTLNVVMEVLRCDHEVRIEPSSALGRATRIRIEVPTGIDVAEVTAASDALYARGLIREAACVLLARGLGLRVRECLLADISRLGKEARRQGHVDIREGIKGGRRVERLVPCDEIALRGLAIAEECSHAGSSNMLAPDETIICVYRGSIHQARAILKNCGIAKFHDLRAAYACVRYRELIGQEPPILGGPRIDMRRHCRELHLISSELGHGRLDVLRAYVG